MGIHPFTCSYLFLIAHVDNRHYNSIRCNGKWPYYPFFIVKLLNSCSHGSGNTPAVTSHYERLTLPVFIREINLHRFRIFGSKLEDVPEFYPSGTVQRCPTSGTGISFHHQFYVDPFVHLKITTMIGVHIMCIFFHATDHIVFHALDTQIAHYLHNFTTHAHRTHKPYRHSNLFKNAILVSKFQRLILQHRFQLVHVQFKVSSYESHYHSIFSFEQQ